MITAAVMHQAPLIGRPALEFFLRTLWPDGLLGQWASFYGLPSEKSFWANGITDDLIGHLLTWAEVENVYIGCGLRGENLGPAQRGLSEAVTAIPGVWVDLDFGDGHKKKNLPPTQDTALELLRELGPPPTLLIHSGHGFHAWWLFREPWVFDSDEDRLKAEVLTKVWCDMLRARAKEQGWDADQVGDLARIMRLPGTWNRKGEQPPCPTRLLHCDDGRRYDPSDLEPYLVANGIAGLAPCSPTVPFVFVINADAEPPAEKFLRLCEIDLKFKVSWEHARTDLQDQSASSYDMSLATRAFAANWTAQEIADLLIACRRKHKDDLKLRKDYY